VAFVSCRILPPQPSVYKGHSDCILDFAVWGQDVISISKNKIGLSSLSRAADEVSLLFHSLFVFCNLLVFTCAFPLFPQAKAGFAEGLV